LLTTPGIHEKQQMFQIDTSNHSGNSSTRMAVSVVYILAGKPKCDLVSHYV
jgi:hypothetical protein